MDKPDRAVPRILFLGARDDANLCNRAARAINLVAGEQRARVWTMDPHPYGYHEDLIADVEPPELAGDWDWIIGTGDGNYQQLARMMAPFDGRARNVAMTHSGSAYRGNPHHYNRSDAVFGARLRFVGADSLHLDDGAIPTVPWFSTCDTIVPAAEPDAYDLERVVVAHSPSNREKKGTDAILEKLEVERLDIAEIRRQCLEADEDGAPPEMVVDLIEGVSYSEARERRAGAHIFVDQMNPAIGGFGASAVEAMAAGCAVLADIRHVAYEQVWQRFGLDAPPIIEVRSPDDLEGEIDRLIKLEGDLFWTRQASLDWAREYAAPAKFGAWFLRMLEQHS